MNISDAVVRAFALLFTGDPDLWRIVWVSLKTSIVGLLLASPPAILIGYVVAMRRFAGNPALPHHKDAVRHLK